MTSIYFVQPRFQSLDLVKVRSWLDSESLFLILDNHCIQFCCAVKNKIGTSRFGLVDTIKREVERKSRRTCEV
jgi:hypothetical protein